MTGEQKKKIQLIREDWGEPLPAASQAWKDIWAMLAIIDSLEADNADLREQIAAAGNLETENLRLQEELERVTDLKNDALYELDKKNNWNHGRRD